MDEISFISPTLPSILGHLCFLSGRATSSRDLPHSSSEDKVALLFDAKDAKGKGRQMGLGREGGKRERAGHRRTWLSRQTKIN